MEVDGGGLPDVEVPAGHKVNVLHAVNGAFLARSESGIWIASLGTGEGAADVIARVASLVASAPIWIVWIVQPALLERAADLDPFVDRLGSIVQRSRQGSWHRVVAPQATGRHAAPLRRLKETGAEIYVANQGDACLVEVHRPDCVVAFIPGSELLDNAAGLQASGELAVSDLFAHGTEADPRDVEQVIFDIAEYKRGEDFDALYDLMRSRPVFVPVETRSAPANDRWGPRYMKRHTVETVVSFARGPHGERWVPALTAVARVRTTGQFHRMEWVEFLRLVLIRKQRVRRLNGHIRRS